MKSRTLGILALINVVYIVLGGVAFHYLETDNEEETKEVTVQFIAQFLSKYL